MAITQEKVKKLFEYKDDGTLVRRIRTSSCSPSGSVAGTLNANGYLRVFIDGRLYSCHRIVWMWHYGYFPEHEVDHINRNRSDNRIENLREVTGSCNRRNTGNPVTNTSGVKGVCWHKPSGKWQAGICFGGRNVFIGRHNDFFEAVCMRLAAEQSLGWDGCDSSSPAFKYVHKNICGGGGD